MYALLLQRITDQIRRLFGAAGPDMPKKVKFPTEWRRQAPLISPADEKPWLTVLSALLDQHTSSRSVCQALAVVESTLKMSPELTGLNHLPGAVLRKAAQQLNQLCDLSRNSHLAGLAVHLVHIEGRQKPAAIKPANAEVVAQQLRSLDSDAVVVNELPGMTLFMEHEQEWEDRSGFAKTDFMVQA
ncbi:hypothetical protein ABIC83_002925 [Roseateles asaccharophilus]|uniref:hypothetical protein n=1 Tax=Roseateles asaccharophilus TaxID=582607 RepID=UPI0038329D47